MIKPKAWRLIAISVLLWCIALTGCRANQARDENSRDESIGELFLQLELDSLHQFLKASDAAFLRNGERLTIFAPLNEAFYDTTATDTLYFRNDFDWQRHVLKGHHYLNDLRHGTTVRMLDGTRVKVAIGNDGVLVGNARIVQSDMDMRDAVVHVVDGFITFAEPPPESPDDEVAPESEEDEPIADAGR